MAHTGWTAPEGFAPPKGWVDSSYGNDSCPSWTNPKNGNILFVEFPEGEREYEGSDQYYLYEGYGESEPLLATDNYSDVQAWIVAKTFGQTLAGYLTAEEMAKAIERNRSELDPMVCHSHDCCDANMAMLEAMEANGYVELMPNDDGYSSVWGKAWSIAVEHDFFSEIKEYFEQGRTK